MADRHTPGTVIRRAHFPGRAPIDAYGNSGFRFADMSHRGSILCLPSGIYGWPPTSFDDINRETLERVLAEAEAIDVLLIGSGPVPRRIGDEISSALRRASISSDAMTTGSAVRTFNVLLAEGRRVAAALIAVE